MIYPAFDKFYATNKAALDAANIDQPTAEARYASVTHSGFIPDNALLLDKVIKSTVKPSDTLSGLTVSLSAKDSQIATLTEENAALTTRAETAEAELADLKAKLAALEKPAQ